MFENPLLWLVLVGVLVASPLLLPLLREDTFDGRSTQIAGGMTAIALALPMLGLGDPAHVWKFLLAQTLLFFSFVCVSRIRQRKSLFLMMLASIGSNGGWFLAMQVLAGAYLASKQGFGNAESLGLLSAALVGTVSGRLIGVQWMTWVEKRFKVRTDSVGSPALKWLDERTQPALRTIFIGTFMCYAVASIYTDSVALLDVSVVMVLGFLQSQVYTVNTRFANRDHPGWPVVTGLLGGIIFIVHWTYLIGYSHAGGFMPLALLVPYTVATVYGANAGAVLSMMLEKTLNLHVDAHVTGKDAFREVTWHQTLLFAVAAVCGVYLVWGDALFALLGWPANDITLPFTAFAGTGWERPVSLLIGGSLFFVQNISHTLSSRAGNRNHAPYHAITCVIHGLVYFGTGTFVVLNAHFLDLIPVAMFGGAMGQLCAQQFSKKMETWLESVMDVPEEPKKA